MRILFLFLTLSLAATAAVEFETVQPGRGATAEMGDYVEIHYVARVNEEKAIENTHRDGDPYVFLLGSGEVLEEVEQGIVGMVEGELRNIKVSLKNDKTLTMQVRLLAVETPTIKERGLDGARNRETAWEIDKPAMFEFMIRDFFSQPWRYESGAEKVINQALPVLGVDLILLAWFFSRSRRR